MDGVSLASSAAGTALAGHAAERRLYEATPLAPGRVLLGTLKRVLRTETKAETRARPAQNHKAEECV